MFMKWKRLLLAVYRLEEGQQEILAKVDSLERRLPPSRLGAAAPLTRGAKGGADEWIQDGIDNILSYSVEKKKEDGE